MLRSGETRLLSATETADASAGAVAATARAAMRRGDWTAALASWDQALSRFPDREAPSWRLGRAVALRELNRFTEAEAGFRDLAAGRPGDLRIEAQWLKCILARCIAEGTFAEMRREFLARLERGLLASPEEADRLQAIRLLEGMGELDLARGELLRVLDRVATHDGITHCVRLIPALFERVRRPALWTKLLERIEAFAEAAPDADERHRATFARLCVLLALEELQEFAELYDRSPIPGLSEPERRLLARVRDRISLPMREVSRESKVFGIGLSKTGTTSLTDALDILGIDSAHWRNPLTGQLLSDIDFRLLGACADACVSHHFERLYFEYPNARFVLTTRPLAAWIRSFRKHYRHQYMTSDFDALRQRLSEGENCRYGSEAAAISAGLYWNHPDEAAAYAAHDRRVRQFFADKPKNKLLILDVFSGDGWPELCGFLEREAPSVAFPWANRRMTPTPDGSDESSASR